MTVGDVAVIRGTALTSFHELVTELGGDSHALVTDAHIPYGAAPGIEILGPVGLAGRSAATVAERATFAGLIDHTRREAAQRLLLETDLGLDRLCRQLGYAEQSVLTRSCKRWFGMTPSGYRNTRIASPRP